MIFKNLKDNKIYLRRKIRNDQQFLEVIYGIRKYFYFGLMNINLNTKNALKVKYLIYHQSYLICILIFKYFPQW